jgi:hypothetical protein
MIFIKSMKGKVSSAIDKNGKKIFLCVENRSWAEENLVRSNTCACVSGAHFSSFPILILLLLNVNRIHTRRMVIKEEAKKGSRGARPWQSKPS